MLDKNNVPFILEVNTIPGFTSTSLLPKAARIEGIDFNHNVADHANQLLFLSQVLLILVVGCSDHKERDPFGNVDSFLFGIQFIWLVKTDIDGIMTWSKTYGGTGWEEVHCVIQTGDGGYAIIGFTTSFGAGGADSWLFRTDSSGNMLWNKTYGGTGTEFTVDITRTRMEATRYRASQTRLAQAAQTCG
jgi:hypothetical protein